ncbi:MAG: T9SS type A sorting domain-containing protein [Porphyromonas sp.]|uniref:T9SS type A sorting domain-containing protein n=1 Tax=Porphyromonas sp. TaxID=1924944 RepID=UPI002A7EB837|nr:T9SS type A sorting domain-containing protein [Porphyromonas sp.]MDY4245040.1 T9SS type A sorting domain-containing protein [Porphyromonas sp.]
MNHLTNRLILLILIPLCLLTGASSGIAQQSFGGTPQLLGEGTLRTATASISLAPDFNPQDLMRRESWHEGSLQRKPYNVGKVVPCSIDFATEAELIGSVAGTDIYRLEIDMEQSPVGLNLYYSDFFIPQGGRLYIYTPGGEQLLGAYTHETHPKHGAFASEPLSGSKLILDYEAPHSSAMPSIQISGVGYLYRSVMQAKVRPTIEKEDASDPGKDKYCQLNINCPEGDDWQEQKSSSVIYMPVFADGNMSLCSGNLVNNAKGDFKPYILTAAHCSGEDGTGKPEEGEFKGGFGIDQSKMDQWVFGFHYEKPRCNNSDYGFQTTKTLTGATIRTYTSPYGYSDGMLLELKNEIPLDYRVYYAGWNATEQTWQSGAGIHHPAGDATKLCLYNKGMIISQWDVPADPFDPDSKPNRGGEKDHYSLHFHTGNTEGGSSGSPLYNEHKEQIATLTGGLTSVCAKDGYYGRLSSHFNKYKDKGDLYHMDMYLDPENTGVLKVAGTWRKGYKPFAPIRELRGKLDLKNHLKVELEWDAVPAHAQGYPISYQIYRNGTPLKEVTETKYTDQLTYDLTSRGSVQYAVEALYDVEGEKISTPAAHRTIYTGKLVKEVNAKVKAEEAGGVKVTWAHPVNAQTISKIADRATMKAVGITPSVWPKLTQYPIDLNLFDRFRLGRSPFDTPLYVHQVNVLVEPSTKSSMQSIYLRQKVNNKRDYVQYFPQPKGDKPQWVSILLKRPYKLNVEENLEVGFRVKGNKLFKIYLDSNSKDEYTPLDGALSTFILNGELIAYPGYEHFSNIGYMALELVVSDSPTLSGDTIRETFTRGPLPVPFPEVKGYVIYRNDQKVGETAPTVLSYKDAGGKEGDNYRIEVLYDAPEKLAIDKSIKSTPQPYLYPSVIRDMATLAEADKALSLQLYDLSGRCLLTLQGDALRSSIDLTDLPEGSYIALIRTMQETFTQRVMIKRNQL